MQRGLPLVIPLALGTVELAAKLAPIVAQALVDVVTTVHDHLQEKARGLPVKVIEEQRRQAQAGASHGLVQGTPLPRGPSPSERQDLPAQPPIWPKPKPQN